MARVKAYLTLMRLNKPIGILLLLWPTLWALWIAAQGKPTFKNLVIFILGVVLMRSAGCVINDYADKDFDRFVKRTKDRPLTTQQVSTKEALLLFIALISGSLVLVLMLNRFTVFLAMIGLMFTIIYPFTKRFFDFPQLILGFAFAWGIPMAFAAQLQALPKITWLLYLATLLWIVAYDTCYGMVDRDDDKRLGLRSTAILFGRWDVWVIALLQVVFLTTLCCLAITLHFKWPFYLSLLVASILLIYQQFLLHHHNRDAYFKAFLNNNWLGLIIFLGVVLNYATV